MIETLIGPLSIGLPPCVLRSDKKMNKQLLPVVRCRGADARLIKLVNELFDVRLNLVAAESLGRLKSEDGLKVLNDTAKKHWYPAVRKAAKTAVSKIKSNSDCELKHHKEKFPFEYFDYQCMNIDLPEAIVYRQLLSPLASAPSKSTTLTYRGTGLRERGCELRRL